MPIIIKETLFVKPAKPTNNVQIPLSNCDLSMPPHYYGFIYFFKNVLKKDNFMNTQKLLTSLEDVLTDYYPLAGTIKSESDGRPIIDCNDHGIQFIIAECSDIIISQLEEKNWEHAVTPHGLMPQSTYNKTDPILFIIQHTTFADGSVALGFSMHHHVVDGFGLVTFLENWGRKARLEQIDPPVLDRSLLKASGNPPTHVPHEYILIKPGLNVPQFSANPSLTTKIFRFNQDNIKRLRDYYSVDISNENLISTNDALVTHIWRTVTRARNVDLNTEVFCGLAINGRDRLNPPIPKTYFGNVSIYIRPKMIVSQLINDSPPTVALQVQKAFIDTNNSRIRSLIDWFEQQPDKSLILPVLAFNDKDFAIVTMPKFPVRNLVDFGDGTPIKQRLRGGVDINGIAMILGAEDEEIEVYICLPTEILENLKHDPEFKKIY